MENLNDFENNVYDKAVAVKDFQEAELLFKEVTYAASTKGCGSGTCIE